MLGDGQWRATATRLFRWRQHAIVIAVHAVEGVAEPLLVFGQSDLAVAIDIHLRQVVAGALHLRVRQQRQRAGQHQDGDAHHHAGCSA